MSERVRVDAQKFSQQNLVLSTTAATVTLPAHCSEIIISNIDASISESVSFDGTNYFNIGAGQSLSVDCDLNQGTFLIKSASGTPTAQMIFGYEG